MTFLGLRHEQKKNEPDPNKHRSTRQPGMTRSLSSLFDTRPPALRIGAYSHCGGATMVQTKLSVNQPGDHYEQEADRVADQVMRMPGASLRLQRKCDCGQHTIGGGGCSECEK